MKPIFLRSLRAFFLSALVGFLPILVLWNNNLGQIAPAAASRSLLYTLLFVVVVFAVWLAAARSTEKAVLLSAATHLLVFSFGHVYNLIEEKTVLGLSIGVVKLALIYAVLFAAAVVVLARARWKPNLLLFAPVAALVLYNAGTIAFFSLRTAAPNLQPAADTASAVSSQAKRDIYFIILDSYARQDILQDVLGYDNSAFVSGLHQRGFTIPACAYSNYAGTDIALASILNFEMLDTLDVPVDQQGSFEPPDLNLTLDSRASQVFRSYGYQFVAGRGYASFNDIRTADLYLNYAEDQGTQDDLAEKRFTSLYLNTTVFRMLNELYRNNPERFAGVPFWLMIDRESDPSLAEANFWYLQNNYMFDMLAGMPQRAGDYFIYAHINAPHGPYVYRADGSFRYPLDDQDEQTRYRDAITHLNRRVLEVIDAIQAQSDPDPVIILQSDHGIHGMTTGLDKHKILSAYYLPLDDTFPAVPVYDTITPVNNFRLVLKNYLDPTTTLLPDTLWVKLLNQYEALPASCDLP